MSRRGSANIARPPARRSSPRPNCCETPLSRPDSRRGTPPISCPAGARLRSRCTPSVARKHSPCSWGRGRPHEGFERLDALRRHREVEQVAAQRETAPEGAKGIAEALGAFLVGLPPGAISGVFDLLKGVLVRAPETPVTVEISSGSTKLTFDPRRVTPAQM